VKTHVVDISDLEQMSPVFRGKQGNLLAGRIIKMFALDRVNALYQRCCEYTGAAFASALLQDLGVQYRLGNAERLEQLPEGAFITISNHPYGGLDGIMLIDLMAHIRSDFKIMVNRLLSLIEAMDVHFISVKPQGNKKLAATANLNGIRETLGHLQEGHPMGFFPSGAVSDFRFSSLRVQDRPWQDSVVKLIQKAKVPILPIRFFDGNSPFFYFLGTINWRIRLIRMPREVFNKSTQFPRLGVGKLISVEEQSRYGNTEDFGALLRRSVYNMSLPLQFIPREHLFSDRLFA